MHPTLSRSAAIARLVAFCLGSSALTGTAMAAVINYPNGSNNAAAIVPTDNSTQLQVLTGSATQSGAIVGNSYALEKIGNGILVLSNGTNSAGVVTISAGTLSLTSGGINAFGKIALNGGVLSVGASTFFVNGMSVGAAGGTVNVGSNVSFTAAAAFTGSGPLTKTGAGAFAINSISGVTPYSGSITVLDGTLSVSGAFPDSSISLVSGTLAVNVAQTTIGSLSGAGNIRVTGSISSLTVGADGSSTTFSGAIDGDAGAKSDATLIKAGAGTLILAGNDSLSAKITGGTLQIGNGGTTGSIAGNIVDNGILVFARSDSINYGGTLSGAGTLVVKQGTLILTNTNTQFNVINNFTGGTLISPGATLQLGNGGNPVALAGVGTSTVTDNGHFIFNYVHGLVGGVLQNTIISGSGDVTVTGGTYEDLNAGNSFSGGLIVKGGSTVQVTVDSALGASASSVTLGDSTSTGSLNTRSSILIARPIVLAGSGILQTFDKLTMTVAGAISGAGGLTLQASGTGTIKLLGTNTYTGNTTIGFGNVQVGDGGTDGTINGNIANYGALTFNRSDTYLLGGAISGTGSLVQAGPGILTLGGTNTYTGGTVVNAGTLNVTGKIGAVTVASGGTIGGTGTVGTAGITGTLAPGAGTPGTLTVAGDLTLASGATYVDSVTPDAASLTSVSGTAGINGTFAANLATGSYTAGKRYTVLTAAGGISGSFVSVSTTGLPSNLKPRLSYDANAVYLNLDPSALAPSLPAGATRNQQGVVAAMDAAFSRGSTPTGGFLALYGLSGAPLAAALDQVSGRAAPNIAGAMGQGFFSFLSMTGSGGSNAGGNFAPGSAYGDADAPHRAQLSVGSTRIWGGAYGGHVGISGDTASGAAALSSSNVGFIGGADMLTDQGLLVGVTFSIGSQTFRSANATGNSSDRMIGLYARTDHGPFYVAAALGYGWHRIKTQRLITISGTDLLQGQQDAEDYGGRLEAGWHVPLEADVTLSPYAAIAGERFENPAYDETALSGASTFALSYAAHASTQARSELGLHLGRSFPTGSGALTAEVHAAWAHQFDGQPFAQARFTGLAGSGFQVVGVRTAGDSALLGAGAQLQKESGLFFSVRGETQLAAGMTVVEGMGNVGWHW